MEEVSWDSKGPLTVAVGSRVDIINGSTLILKCVSSGVPPAKLTWTRGIDALSEDDKYTIGEQTLTIRNVQYADADEYTCTASNQAGQDAATTELVVKGASLRQCSFQLSAESNRPLLWFCFATVFDWLEKLNEMTLLKVT